jgi:hypothetical protein
MRPGAPGSATCRQLGRKDVAAAKKWVDAGFTHLALVQVGASTRRTFVNWAERDLLPALRKLG